MECTHIIPTTRRGDVTFHADGRIDLTAHVTKSLDLHVGDVINIIKTGGDYPEHLLYRARRASDTIGRHACVCHATRERGRYLRVFNKRMAQYFLGICQCDKQVSLRTGGLAPLTGHNKAITLIVKPK